MAMIRRVEKGKSLKDQHTGKFSRPQELIHELEKAGKMFRRVVVA